MTDGPQEYRRASDRPVSERLSIVEVEMRQLAKSLETALALIGKLDARADKQDIALARLLAGVAVLMFAGQLAAPAILQAIGITR